MQKFGRREFIRVVGQSAAALIFGIPQKKGWAKPGEMVKTQEGISNSISIKEVVDIHCHLFGIKYPIKELATATWNYLFGNYPHKYHITKQQKISTKQIGAVQGVKDFATWIARLLDVALSDCKGNYQTANDMFENSAMRDKKPLFIAPLMMDIYFALDDNMDEMETQGKKQEAIPFEIDDDQKGQFEEHLNEIERLIDVEYQNLSISDELVTKKARLKDIFQEVKRELMETDQKILKKKDYERIELSPGYESHMRELEEICEKHSGEVFPFLAADPRRIGIMELIKMKVDQGRGVFKGIKLYPPLGYIPTHPNLVEIYDYCQTHQIPVTVHCSDGGIRNFKKKNYVRRFDGPSYKEDFKSVDGNKSRFYATPNNWKAVLKRWPELRINLAHFGGGDNFWSGDIGWMGSIINLMKEYQNVFADLSYHTNPEIPRKLEKLVAENAVLEDRLMFGTDFIMIMLDRNCGGLKHYFNRFSGLDNKLLCENAKKFLKI